MVTGCQKPPSWVRSDWPEVRVIGVVWPPTGLLSVAGVPWPVMAGVKPGGVVQISL